MVNVRDIPPLEDNLAGENPLRDQRLRYAVHKVNHSNLAYLDHAEFSLPRIKRVIMGRGIFQVELTFTSPVARDWPILSAVFLNRSVIHFFVCGLALHIHRSAVSQFSPHKRENFLNIFHDAISEV